MNLVLLMNTFSTSSFPKMRCLIYLGPKYSKKNGVSQKLETMGDEVVVVYLKVQSWYSPERTEKTHKNLRITGGSAKVSKVYISTTSKTHYLCAT